MVAERLVVGYAEGPRGEVIRERLAGVVQQADGPLPHDRRVGAALGLRPGHPDAGSALHRGQPWGRRRSRIPGVGGQDRPGERLVDRAAVGDALRELGPVGSQRAIGTRRALPGDLLVDVAPDRHVLGERAADRLALDRSAAECDHRGRAPDLAGERVQHRDDQPLLPAPELDLALTLEEGGDRLPQLALQKLVGVDHPKSQPLGHGLRRPRLARRHEADEDDPVVRAHLFHPMRCLYASRADSTSSM